MIDVLIIHYNTPELTEAAIRSLWKHTPDARVTLLDNSDRRPFLRCGNSPVFTYIDNTNGQIVDWDKWLAKFPDKRPSPENNWGSAKHCYSVEVCLDMFPNGFVLMDADVLIKRDITPLCDRSAHFSGTIVCDSRKVKNRIDRLSPCLCWINTPLLRPYGIRYFNPDKMWKLHSYEPNCAYDTGAWFLEAVSRAGLEGNIIDIKDYIEHFRHASWKSRPVEKWLNKHKKLWEGEPIA